MLASTTTFPHAGSICFLKPEGQELRIVQHRCDGRLLVQRIGPEWSRSDRASGTMTVDRKEVAANQIDAITPRKRRAAVGGKRA